jgi:integrase
MQEHPDRHCPEIKINAMIKKLNHANDQDALAVAILCYMPVRLQNLTALTFDVHLFLRDGERVTSSLELPSDEVKNRTELAFDIPSHIAKMLLEYRNSIAPKIIGHRPERVFVTIDGSPKSHATLAVLIRTHLRRHAGIVMSAHQFRHLSAKILLDAEPGSFETVRQLLGHKNLRMTVGAYAGIDSRRAARHHQRLVEDALAAQKPIQQRKKRAS